MAHPVCSQHSIRSLSFLPLPFVEHSVLTALIASARMIVRRLEESDGRHGMQRGGGIIGNNNPISFLRRPNLSWLEQRRFLHRSRVLATRNLIFRLNRRSDHFNSHVFGETPLCIISQLKDPEIPRLFGIRHNRTRRSRQAQPYVAGISGPARDRQCSAGNIG
jgi:hypothetical protein